MSIRINTNIDSIIAQNRLEKNSFNLSKTLERLSTGLRINKSADDPAGMAVAKKMESISRSTVKALDNIQYGMNYIETAEGGLQEICNLLQRIRELVIKAANDSNTKSDREKIQEEIDQLYYEIEQIPIKTEFNGIQPLQIPPERLKQLTEIPGPVDICFIIDGGGSISPYVMNIQANLTNFINSLTGRNVAPNFSIVLSAYGGPNMWKDNTDATGLALNTTSDQATVLALLGSGLLNTWGTSQDTYSSLIETTFADGMYPGGPPGPLEPDNPTRTMLEGKPVPYFQILVTDHGPEQQVGMFTGYMAPDDPARELAVANFLTTQDVVTYVICETTSFNRYDDITTATMGGLFDVNSMTFGQELLMIADAIASISLAREGKMVNDIEAKKIQIGPTEGDYIGIDQPHINNFFLGITGIDVSKYDKNQTYYKITDDNLEELKRYFSSNIITQLSTLKGVQYSSKLEFETALDSLFPPGTLTQGDKELIEVFTQASPFDRYIDKIDNALETISEIRTNFGAKYNRLVSRMNSLNVSYENLESSKSRIENTDFAIETTNLVKNQILVQAGVAILTQANINPQSVLNLLNP